MPVHLRRVQGLVEGGAGATSGKGPGHRSQAALIGGHGGQDWAESFGSAGGGGFRLGVLPQGAGAGAGQLDATNSGGVLKLPSQDFASLDPKAWSSHRKGDGPHQRPQGLAPHLRAQCQ